MTVLNSNGFFWHKESPLDRLRETRFLSAEQTGWLQKLRWEAGCEDPYGSVPDDPNVLYRLAGAENREQFEANSAPVLAKLEHRDGRYWATDLVAQYRDYQDRVDGLKAAGARGAAKRWGSNSPPIATLKAGDSHPMAPQMGSDGRLDLDSDVEVDKTQIQKETSCAVASNGTAPTRMPPECARGALKKSKRAAPAPTHEPAEPPVIMLPLNDATEYAVTLAEVTEWQELYPAIDVRQQLRNMKGWCLANKIKRKTRSGIVRFITGWLKKEQDRGPSRDAERSRANGRNGKGGALVASHAIDYESGADYIFRNDQPA